MVMGISWTRNPQGFQHTTKTNAAGALTLDNSLVISQLTNGISVQNEEAIKSKNLHHKDIERQIEQEEKKRTEPRKFTLPSSTCSDMPQPLKKMMRQKKLLQCASVSSTLTMVDWHSTN